jgi:hypothetical protein
MTLAEWLAEGAEPSKLTPEEVRRQQNLLAVREEQGAARLEAALEEQEDLFRRGARSASEVLRRVLARRHKRLGEQSDHLEGELRRIGKEMAGLDSIQKLLRDGTALASPGDCSPLLRLLDDVEVGEDEFAETLAQSLRSGKVSEPTGSVSLLESRVMDVWSQMDRGEIPDVDEGLRKLHDA